jgi:hypothetical protein
VFFYLLGQAHFHYFVVFFWRKTWKIMFFNIKCVFLANIHFFGKEIIKNIVGPQVILCVVYFHYFDIFKEFFGKEMFI